MHHLVRVASLLSLVAGNAVAAEYSVPQHDEVFGAAQVISARYEDTFVEFAQKYNVGYEALKRANPGVDPWLPGEGTRVVIPTQFVLPHAPQRGIIVNIAELRLYYFPDDGAGTADAHGNRRIVTYPISIGQLDWSTPLGTTKVTGKVLNPSWYPPQSIRDEHAARDDALPRVVPPGPDNPLGKHALRLGLPSYLIHGTNMPSGIGMRVTHGCVRMFPWDIEALYKVVPDRHAGHDRESAVQARLDRAGSLSRGSSAAREGCAESDGRAEQNRHRRGRRAAGRIVDRAHARLCRCDSDAPGRHALGFGGDGDPIGARVARADHDGPARGQGRRGREQGIGRKKKPPSYVGGFRIQMRPRPHPIIFEYSPRRYFFCFCSNMRSSL